MATISAWARSLRRDASFAIDSPAFEELERKGSVAEMCKIQVSAMRSRTA